MTQTTNLPPMHCDVWMQPSANSTTRLPEWACRVCGATFTRAGVCDFCSDPNPVVNETARDFDVAPSGSGVSLGDWGACQECHDMITAGRWLDLEERAIKAMRAKYPYSSRADIRLAVQSLQRQFRIHRSA